MHLTHTQNYSAILCHFNSEHSVLMNSKELEKLKPITDANSNAFFEMRL